MTFRSPVQPHCRWCGAGIRKETHTHYFGQTSKHDTDYSTDHPETPATKAEVQRLVNGTVVSIGRDAKGGVWKATTWDHESWRDEFFCNGDHARRFGYAAARMDLGMPEYHEAMKKLR